MNADCTYILTEHKQKLSALFSSYRHLTLFLQRLNINITAYARYLNHPVVPHQKEWNDHFKLDHITDNDGVTITNQLDIQIMNGLYENFQDDFAYSYGATPYLVTFLDKNTSTLITRVVLKQQDVIRKQQFTKTAVKTQQEIGLLEYNVKPEPASTNEYQL